MKKRKLFLALGLAAVMTAASMAGCGGNKADKKDDNKTEMSSDKKEDAANDNMADANNADSSADDNMSADDTQDQGADMSTHSDDSLSMFTKALVGKDDDGNSYFYVYNDDESFVALVMLSADATTSMNSVGAAVENGDGTVTIQDPNMPLTYQATPADDGVEFILFDPSGGGNDAKAIIRPYEDVNAVIDLIKAIDSGTEIVNPLQ